MSRHTRLLMICLLVLVALGLTSFTASQSLTPSSAQSAQSSGELTLQALLGEVHQLRVAMQRSNLNTYHAQITIERMKLQQQRVDRLNSQLNDTHQQLIEIRTRVTQFSTAAKNAESELMKEANVAKRAEREEVLQSLKGEIEMLTQKEQQQREIESQLQTQLQLEQAKLTELNERLDALQRELETQLSTDKQAPSGKRPN